MGEVVSLTTSFALASLAPPSFPKPNKYQSLHTAIICNGQVVEVQIRTAQMHHVAEVGMASHWAYQSTKRGSALAFDTPWLSSIKEWQQDKMSSRAFVESVRKELLGKRVFVCVFAQTTLPARP